MDYPRDIWVAIISHIDCGSVYKALCLTDKLRRKVVMTVHPTGDTKFANHFLTLLTMIDAGTYQPAYFHLGRTYPKNAWEIESAISNPNITPAILDSHPEWDELWDWGYLTDNPNLTIQWLERRVCNAPAKCYNAMFNASDNPCVTIGYVLDNSNQSWDWRELSGNPSMTAEIIEAYPDLPWDLEGLIENPNITWELLSKQGYSDPSCIYMLSKLPIITIEIVRSRPDIQWNRFGLTVNPNVTLEIIKANPDIPWSVVSISYNPTITIDDILANPQIPWKPEIITRNANMTPKIIKAHPEILWDISVAHHNPSITWADVESNPDGVHGQRWNLSLMGGKPDLTWKKIVEWDPIARWDWEIIAKNTFGK